MAHDNILQQHVVVFAVVCVLELCRGFSSSLLTVHDSESCVFIFFFLEPGTEETRAPLVVMDAHRKSCNDLTALLREIFGH